MKIFDFGLGKEIPSYAKTETDAATHQDDATRETWRLTAMVGTPRYSKSHTRMPTYIWKVVLLASSIQI